MTAQAHHLVVELDAQFQSKANATKAPAMETYMRNQFKFYGLPSPERRAIVASVRSSFKKIEPASASAFAQLCWEYPNREMQYAGMELFFLFATDSQTDVIGTCEHLIATKSWWDTVDYIAPNIVGTWLKHHPDEIVPVTTRWINSGNIWLQRSTLLFQLKYNDNLDFNLLCNFINQLNHHPDFFIRKAIGWALRSHAKQDPNAVRQFVNNTEMSGLSRREALKHIGAD